MDWKFGGMRTTGMLCLGIMALAGSASGKDYDPLEIVRVPEPSPAAIRFHQTGHWIWAGSVLLSAGIPLLILISPIGPRIQAFSLRHGYGRIGAVVCFVTLTMIAAFLMRLPWSFAAGHLRLRAYGLSEQTTLSWLADVAKSVVVNIVIQCLIASIVWGFLVVRFPKTWWLWTAAGTLPFLILGVFLTPLVIDPLFNKFGPLRDRELEAGILQLATRAGVAEADVFEVDKSRQTKAVNAYVTGLSGSKRIVLWDTLIAKLPPREVRAVVAHELGHYVLGHVRWGVLIGGLSSFAGMFILDRALRWTIAHAGGRLHVSALADLNAMVLMIVLITIGELLAAPISNAVSRTMEHQADVYAIELTRDPAAVAHAFASLQQENLSVPFPNWFYRTWRSTHPVIGERIEFANGYRPWKEGGPGRYGISAAE